MSANADVIAALERLRMLAPNWDGYGASAIDGAIIDAAQAWVKRLPMELGFTPHVVPMSTGRFELEWDHKDKLLQLEFSVDSIEYYKLCLQAGVEEMETFPITDMDKSVELIRWFVTRTPMGKEATPDA